MADLFNKTLLDINVNLYIRIFGSTNIGLTNSKRFHINNATASIFELCKKLYLKNKILTDLVMLKYEWKSIKK